MTTAIDRAIARIRTGYYIRHIAGDTFALVQHRRDGKGKTIVNYLVSIGESDLILARYSEKVKP